MKYSQLFSIIDNAGWSCETAANRLGVSHMTLRRWRAKPPKEQLPKMYARSFAPVFNELASEGGASAGSVARAVGESNAEPFRQTLKRLGFPDDLMSRKSGGRTALIDGLSKVGDSKERKETVDRSKPKLASFRALGSEWKERISAMSMVIRSGDLLATDKLVAYGALFYLLMPMDLIPDTIPAIGLLDDFAVLGIALWFYKKRFPHLFA